MQQRNRRGPIAQQRWRCFGRRARILRFLGRSGGGGGGARPPWRSGRRGHGHLRGRSGSLVLGRCFSVLLVLESVLDDLGLGAIDGALNPLDVLVILVGCQDCLQLRLQGVRLHLGICIYHCAFGCDYVLTSSNQHHFVQSFSAHDNTKENSSPELKNNPYWIVGLTELHKKSIKNRMRGRKKSYNH